MCRHIGYLGASISPASALLDDEHCLRVQSYAPRDMRCAAVANADGFGLGWFGSGEVRCYRREGPLWSDQGIEAVARSVRTTAFVAAARSATVGMPVMESACAPFSDAGWLFSHNGVVPGWPKSLAGIADARLSTADLMTLEAPTDSAVLWALLRARLNSGQHPAAALAELVCEVRAEAPDAKLNFLLTNGAELYATAVVHSLSYRQLDDGVVVASEPLSRDGGWISVPDDTLVTATAVAVNSTLLSKAGQL